MMTMHSAKGLEFPVVFVVGVEEGIFPGNRAIGDDEEMEEERRLCYVAMTRAKEELYLTCASQRMLFGRTSANRPSRFIGEIPEEYVEKSGRSYLSEPDDASGRWQEARGFQRGSYGSPWDGGAPRHAAAGEREARPARLPAGGRGGTQGLRQGDGAQRPAHGRGRPAGDRLRHGGHQTAHAQVGGRPHEEGVRRRRDEKAPDHGSGAGAGAAQRRASKLSMYRSQMRSISSRYLA